MTIDEPPAPNKLVQALQSPAAVVSYRAIVGVATLIITGLIGFIGHDIEDGIAQLQAAMVQVQVAISHNSGRIDGQDSRLGRDEQSIDNLSIITGSLDHRVTVIEAKQGAR